MIYNLPSVIGLQNQPNAVVPRKQNQAGLTDDSNKARFVIDASGPKLRGQFTSNLTLLDDKNAANQAGSFQILLKEQQETQNGNANEPFEAPYTQASSAYIAAEHAATFAHPTATDLGSI